MLASGCEFWYPEANVLLLWHNSHIGFQGLRASSLQFTSPLEFNAIFRDGSTLRLDLTAGSKIRDPVTAKFKHARLL